MAKSTLQKFFPHHSRSARDKVTDGWTKFPFPFLTLRNGFAVLLKGSPPAFGYGMESYIDKEAMKTVTLTPDQLPMGAQLVSEWAVRGDSMPHWVLHLSDGVLMLIRLKNMHWANRLARREAAAIAAARIPMLDANCPHCGARLSSGSPAQLVFLPVYAPSDRAECSPLCHTCAALPNEELLAAHIRRGQKIVLSRSASSPRAIAEANQMTENQQMIRDFVSEQFVNASNCALDILKTEGRLPPLYFIWLRDGSDRLICGNETLALLFWVAGDARMVAHFAGAWRVPKDAPDESDQRREVVVGEIIARTDDGVQLVNGWTRKIHREADGTVSGFGELTNKGHLQSEVLDAFPPHPPSPAECHAAKRQLKRQLQKLGAPKIVRAAGFDIVH
jgi:hypothetical protein